MFASYSYIYKHQTEYRGKVLLGYQGKGIKTYKVAQVKSKRRAKSDAKSSKKVVHHQEKKKMTVNKFGGPWLIKI